MFSTAVMIITHPTGGLRHAPITTYILQSI